MNILFLHNKFPGEFSELGTILARDPENHVVFATNCQDDYIPKVQKIIYELGADSDQNPYETSNLNKSDFCVHPLVVSTINQLSTKLIQNNFYPDLIYSYLGLEELLIKHYFPKATYFLINSISN
ncbi:hypothetical protein RIVM261_039420 [Rivularia sp. IAM M-261]|nr:hypothetical protein CAL7716_078540 [Calothrix sp. PCC 7716]GJD18986.1 hypothetical protein RIVM261_039420 [Rivularia sp. IAM M-261]